MSEDKARKLISSVRRWNRRSGKTDMELIEDYQNGAMVAGGILLFCLSFSVSPVIENFSSAVPLLLCCLMFLVILNSIGKCIGAKKLLIEKQRFNFD